jgi:Zn finger protein HypA/HybF involved in hydrogenase expression
MGRTHTGRVLRKEALSTLETPHDPSRGYAECRNCSFVASEKTFINGCPNCNSREKTKKSLR